MSTDDISEIRNNGPFDSLAEAQLQFANWSQGLPGDPHQQSLMLLLEAMLLVGLKPTAFEVGHLNGQSLDPVTAQIFASWLIRAHLDATGHQPTEAPDTSGHTSTQ